VALAREPTAPGSSSMGGDSPAGPSGSRARFGCFLERSGPLLPIMSGRRRPHRVAGAWPRSAPNCRSTAWAAPQGVSFDDAGEEFGQDGVVTGGQAEHIRAVELSSSGGLRLLSSRYGRGGVCRYARRPVGVWRRRLFVGRVSEIELFIAGCYCFLDTPSLLSGLLAVSL
jgi:hypothetical protein